MIKQVFKEAQVLIFISLPRAQRGKPHRNLKLGSLQLEELDNLEEMITYLRYLNFDLIEQ